jgi:hypothetical protein
MLINIKLIEDPSQIKSDTELCSFAIIFFNLHI